MSILCIEKDGDVRYIDWSSITDAPYTFGLTRTEFEKYYRERFGCEGMFRLPHRLERAERTGTSSHVGDDLETCLHMFNWEWFTGLEHLDRGITFEALWHWYCDLRQDPSPDTMPDFPVQPSDDVHK